MTNRRNPTNGANLWQGQPGNACHVARQTQQNDEVCAGPTHGRLARWDHQKSQGEQRWSQNVKLDAMPEVCTPRNNRT